MGTFKLKYKIWLDKGGKAFGDGPLDILQRIQKSGSISRAAEEINMSYSQAWNLIRTLEGRLGFRLLKRRVGGERGGGSELTHEAEMLVDRYRTFRQRADEALGKLYEETFGDV